MAEAAPTLSPQESARINQVLKSLAVAYAERLKQQMGEALVAVALFGSVARGEAGPHSDIDLLIIAHGLPRSRFARQKMLEAADAFIEPQLRRLLGEGIFTDISPVLKTPEEAERITPLFFDMLEDALILHEHQGFFSAILERLGESFRRLGARRIQRGSIRYWELKPDYQPGEIFEI